MIRDMHVVRVLGYLLAQGSVSAPVAVDEGRQVPDVILSVKQVRIGIVQDVLSVVADTLKVIVADECFILCVDTTSARCNRCAVLFDELC